MYLKSHFCWGTLGIHYTFYGLYSAQRYRQCIDLTSRPILFLEEAYIEHKNCVRI